MQRVRKNLPSQLGYTVTCSYAVFLKFAKDKQYLNITKHESFHYPHLQGVQVVHGGGRGARESLILLTLFYSLQR